MSQRSSVVGYKLKYRALRVVGVTRACPWCVLNYGFRGKERLLAV